MSVQIKTAPAAHGDVRPLTKLGKAFRVLMAVPLLLVTTGQKCLDAADLFLGRDTETLVVEQETLATVVLPGRAFRGVATSCGGADIFGLGTQGADGLEALVYRCSGSSCSQLARLEEIDTSLDCECRQNGDAVCVGVRVAGSSRSVLAYAISDSGSVRKIAEVPGQSSDCYSYPDGNVGFAAYTPEGRGRLNFYRCQDSSCGQVGTFSPGQNEGNTWDENSGASQFNVLAPIAGRMIVRWTQVFQGLSLVSYSLANEAGERVGATVTTTRDPQPVPGFRATSSDCSVSGSGIVVAQLGFPYTMECVYYGQAQSGLRRDKLQFGLDGFGECDTDVIDTFKQPFSERPNLGQLRSVELGSLNLSSVLWYQGNRGFSNLAFNLPQRETEVQEDDSFRMLQKIPPARSILATSEVAHRIEPIVRQIPLAARLGTKVTFDSDPGDNATAQQAAGDTVEFIRLSWFHRITFPQFGNGSGFFSQISLNNPDRANPVRAQLRIRNPAGAPLPFTLTGDVLTIPGSNAAGVIDLELAPGARRTLRTDGAGDVVVGSVVVESDRRLSGVVLFGGPFGLAGVPAVATIQAGFSAPVEAIAASMVDTGIAVASLSNRAVRLTPTLVDSDNNVLASAAPIDLPAQGQQALFVTQFAWSVPVNLSDFRGTLRIEADGPVAAAAIQTRPGQLATLPVTPF